MKYRNQPTRCAEGVMHQSRLECDWCNRLHAMQRGGAICDLEAHPQPVYRLEVNGTHVCKYIADFRWLENGQEHVADAKGFKTQVYELKKRLMLACGGIEIEELR